jgi:hypothetical protein
LKWNHRLEVQIEERLILQVAAAVEIELKGQARQTADRTWHSAPSTPHILVRHEASWIAAVSCVAAMARPWNRDGCAICQRNDRCR